MGRSSQDSLHSGDPSTVEDMDSHAEKSQCSIIPRSHGQHCAIYQHARKLSVMREEPGGLFAYLTTLVCCDQKLFPESPTPLN